MANKNPTYKFKKGQSGNPNGRPKKEHSMSNILQDIVDKTETKDGKKILIKAELMQKAVDLARKGDLTAIKFVIDRLEGRAKESVDLSFKTDVDPDDHIDEGQLKEATKELNKILLGNKPSVDKIKKIKGTKK